MIIGWGRPVRGRDSGRMGMFRHVVLFNWTGQETDAQVRSLRDALAKLPGAIPEIRAYHFGSDAGINPANSDFAVVADFDDAEGYVTYRDHPVHREVVERYVSPIVESRAAVQYEF
jgi:Stress responsive A/B Barrel Domain